MLTRPHYFHLGCRLQFTCNLCCLLVVASCLHVSYTHKLLQRIAAWVVLLYTAKDACNISWAVDASICTDTTLLLARASNWKTCTVVVIKRMRENYKWCIQGPVCNIWDFLYCEKINIIYGAMFIVVCRSPERTNSNVPFSQMDLNNYLKGVIKALFSV